MSDKLLYYVFDNNIIINNEQFLDEFFTILSN